MDNLSGNSSWQVHDTAKTYSSTEVIKDDETVDLNVYNSLLEDISKQSSELLNKVYITMEMKPTKGLYDLYVTAESLNKLIKDGL